MRKNRGDESRVSGSASNPGRTEQDQGRPWFRRLSLDLIATGIGLASLGVPMLATVGLGGCKSSQSSGVAPASTGAPASAAPPAAAPDDPSAPPGPEPSAPAGAAAEPTALTIAQRKLASADEPVSHGGEVVRQGESRFELVPGNGGALNVYVTDASGAAVPPAHVALGLRLQRPSGDRALVRLDPSADGSYLTASVANLAPGPVEAELLGSVDGQPVRARFKNVVVPAREGAGSAATVAAAADPAANPPADGGTADPPGAAAGAGAAPAGPRANRGPHGGYVQRVGSKRVEIVPLPRNQVAVHVTALDGTPVPNELVGTSLRLRHDGKVRVIPLRPSPEGHHLVGTVSGPRIEGEAPGDLEMRVDGEPLRASFGSLAVAAPAVAVTAPTLAIGAPGVAVRGPGVAVVGPGVAVAAPGVTVVGPGVAVAAPGVAVVGPGVAVTGPGIAVGAPGVVVGGGVGVGVGLGVGVVGPGGVVVGGPPVGVVSDGPGRGHGRGHGKKFKRRR